MTKIIYIFFLITISFAQSQLGDIKIADVKVKGNQITSEKTIVFTAGLKEGEYIKPTDFPRAVKRLWQLGLFQDVQIVYDEQTKDGVSLIIKVKENFVLGEIQYNGNKKIKDNKIEDEINISTGQRIKPNTLNSVKKTIKTLYAEKGYLNAQISYNIVMPDKKSTLYKEAGKGLVRDVVFEIKENKKTKIKNIIFKGNESFSDFRLRWEMKETKQQPWYLFWRSNFEKKKFEEDMNLISTFYKNKGYRDFHFIKDTIEYYDDKRMNIVFSIKEGPKYKYRNFSWEGMTLFDEVVLERALGLNKSEKYSEEDFNMAVYSRVQGLYLDRGYIYSRVEPQVTPVGEDSLDVHFMITENHKVYINKINILGNTRTRENVIRRQLRVFPGDVYSQDLIARSYREVMMLNFFANVAPNVVPISDDKVDLDFSVEEKPAGQASANMGYSQYYGLTGGGGLSLPNFRGKGQSFTFSYNEGINSGGQNSYMYQGYNVDRPKNRRVSISFTDPMVNDTKNLLGASLGYDMRGGGSAMYYSPLETVTAYGSFMWGRIFKWPDDFFRGTWRLMMRRRSYSGSQADLDKYVGGRTKTDGISFVQTIKRDSRDHPEFPTLGSHFSLNSTLSGWVLGGQENFQKHIINLEWYTPTFWKFVLTTSLKIGVAKELPARDGKSSYIPFYDRFIMGGNGIPYGNPLRGYDDNRVGPITSNGNPIGGNTMIKIGSEFRVPFAENPVVYGLIFAEMGNVWSSEELMERLDLPRSGPLDLKRSIGAGIRFFMPMIGMLGFDIGYGYDRVNQYGEKEPAWKTTLTFGQQF